MKSGTAAEIMRNFPQPSCEFRGAPFWSWNGALEPEELRRQIRQMKAAGLGGFFMHSRVGLATPYLSEQWFECVKSCIDEAEKLEMKAYLYDEDRWPSGAAGGLVTAEERYRMRQVVATECADVKLVQWGADTLALFRARIDGDRASAVERLTQVPAALAPGETLVHFQIQVQPPSPWYNDAAYLDTMNPEAVERFIAVTYEAYYREVGDQFGHVTPAIFTDEPNYGAVNCRDGGAGRSRPWTPGLPELFRRRFGYELDAHWMEIFYQVDGAEYPLAQLHYMEAITSLFVDSFGRQIGEWCGRHGIAFTGHLLCEDTLSSQANCVGNCMRFYEHMQLPGMDQLSEFWQIFDTVKQLASAARQFDRPWRLSETYGCTGWHFPFAGHKAIGDWQSVLGVNLRCQHLAWYTMAGEAKRDYPSAISRQSPWFPYYATVEDYFARVNTVTSVGREVRDILVVHPIESMWLLMNGDWQNNPRVRALDDAFAEVRNTLMRNNLDFDYGDEDIMGRHARVEKRPDGAVLIVGAAEYRAVVLPPALTMRGSTLELLRRFRAEGGVVVAVDAGRLPERLGGLPNAELTAELRRMTAGSDWLAVLDRQARRVRLVDAAGAPAEAVLYQLRERADGWSLFLCNTGFEHRLGTDMLDQTRALERTRRYEKLTVTIAGDSSGDWYEFDPVDGGIYRAAARQVAGGWELDTALEALGTRLFLQLPVGSVTGARERPGRTVVRSEALDGGTWEYELTEPNVVVFDVPEWRVGDEAWHPAEFILHVDDRVRELAGVRPRGGSMVQPWARQLEQTPHLPVTLRFRFQCDELPVTPVWWALEDPAVAQVRINGVLLPQCDDAGFWVDESLRKLEVPVGTLRHGENLVEVAIDYDVNGNGLEAMFLLGHFGVRPVGSDNVLTRLPERLAIGDWGKQGLPYYSGNLAYSTDWVYHPAAGEERRVVKFEAFGGVAVRVLVNGQAAGVAGWPPFEVEVTEWLRPGNNRLTLEVLGCRRNSHGPFYLKDLYLPWTGPSEMKQYDCKDRLLMPSGLLSAPQMRIVK